MPAAFIDLFCLSQLIFNKYYVFNWQYTITGQYNIGVQFYWNWASSDCPCSRWSCFLLFTTWGLSLDRHEYAASLVWRGVQWEEVILVFFTIGKINTHHSAVQMHIKPILLHHIPLFCTLWWIVMCDPQCLPHTHTHVWLVTHRDCLNVATYRPSCWLCKL